MSSCHIAVPFFSFRKVQFQHLSDCLRSYLLLPHSLRDYIPSRGRLSVLSTNVNSVVCNPATLLRSIEGTIDLPSEEWASCVRVWLFTVNNFSWKWGAWAIQTNKQTHFDVHHMGGISALIFFKWDILQITSGWGISLRSAENVNVLGKSNITSSSLMLVTTIPSMALW